MQYILSKLSIFGGFLCVIGAILTIQGIIVRCNLANIKESYNKFEIRNGRYIECDIAKEDLVGLYFTNADGSTMYGAYCNTDAFSSKDTYIVAVSENLNYYVPLMVARKYQKEFRKMINSDDTYHLVGKFNKFRGILFYDDIAECMGINDRSKLDQLLCTDHQIRVVDLEVEKKILYKGFAILVIGLLIFFPSLGIERRKLDVES